MSVCICALLYKIYTDINNKILITLGAYYFIVPPSETNSSWLMFIILVCYDYRQSQNTAQVQFSLRYPSILLSYAPLKMSKILGVRVVVFLCHSWQYFSYIVAASLIMVEKTTDLL